MNDNYLIEVKKTNVLVLTAFVLFINFIFTSCAFNSYQINETEIMLLNNKE